MTVSNLFLILLVTGLYRRVNLVAIVKHHDLVNIYDMDVPKLTSGLMASVEAL